MIKNDEAAQLLCAIFNQKPWLAIKRVSLFESDNHAQIFHHGISAHHIILADEIKQAVQRNKDIFPDAYRSSWLLTRLVACYLVGRIAQEAGDGAAMILADPKEALERGDLTRTLDRWAKMAGAILGERRDSLEAEDAEDEFRKAFKNESTLRALGAQARRSYKMLQIALEND